MGLLRRIFGGERLGEELDVGAQDGAAPGSKRAALTMAGAPWSERGGDSHWRALPPMPRALPSMAPVLQLKRFELSLATRSQPTFAAPLVHDRAARYPSGVAEGIAVLAQPLSDPAPSAAATSDQHPAEPGHATGKAGPAKRRTGIVQRYTRPGKGQATIAPAASEMTIAVTPDKQGPTGLPGPAGGRSRSRRRPTVGRSRCRPTLGRAASWHP